MAPPAVVAAAGAEAIDPGGPSPVRWMARQTRSGVHGIATSDTPYGRSASTTALTTAGVEAIVPASPTPLTPSGLLGRRRLGAVGDEVGQVGRRRHQVVDHRAGDQVAVGVVDRLLEQRLRDALGERRRAPGPRRSCGLTTLPTSSTATYDRIFDRAGLGVDLDRAQVGAVRVGEVVRVERWLGVQRRLHAVGQVVRGERGERDLLDRLLRVRRALAPRTCRR